jgi:predicted dinucleotide-binding enzyme
VILAPPLGELDRVDPAPLAGRIVIDATNHWWEVDGERPDLTDPRVSTSELVQRAFPASTVVKAFNHMGYHHLDDGARPAGAVDRHAIAIAADDAAAAAAVARFVDAIGFDPVTAGTLHDSIALQPFAEAFGANLSAPRLEALLAGSVDSARGREVADAREGVPVGR